MVLCECGSESTTLKAQPEVPRPSELALYASLDGGICGIARRVDVQSSNAALVVDHGLRKDTNSWRW